MSIYMSFYKYFITLLHVIVFVKVHRRESHKNELFSFLRYHKIKGDADDDLHKPLKMKI